MTDAKSEAGSQEKIDWDAVRDAALNCLNATWSMIRFADRSQSSEYDAQAAIAQLDDIDRARTTFRQAMETLEPGFECSSDPEFRDSRVFKALLVAISHQSTYPEFRFGPISCGTAHEAAFELLRHAILWIENGLIVELEEVGAPDHHVASIDDLHKLTPGKLRATLSKLGKRKSIQSIIQARETKQIRAWIDREWAAVIAGSETNRQPNAATNAQIDEPEIGSEQMIAKTCEALKGQSLKIFLFLSRQKHKTAYGTLLDNVWEKEVEETSISRAIERLAESLNKMTPQYFTVVNEFQSRRVWIEPLSAPPPKLTPTPSDK